MPAELQHGWDTAYYQETISTAPFDVDEKKVFSDWKK